MNHYHGTATNHTTAEISYLSPRGHYYVAKGELDTRYARHAHFIDHRQPSPAAKAGMNQLELAKRASRG